MTNFEAVKQASNTLERELRNADEDFIKAVGWNKTKALKRRNALNAACNALFRFEMIKTKIRTYGHDYKPIKVKVWKLFGLVIWKKVIQ